jgi:hypothetical protein
MMCAATANWTLFTDILSPVEYVMLKDTIGYSCGKAWVSRVNFAFSGSLFFVRFFSVLTPFLEFNPRLDESIDTVW